MLRGCFYFKANYLTFKAITKKIIKFGGVEDGYKVQS